MNPTLFAVLIYVAGVILVVFLNWRLGVYLLKRYQKEQQKKEKDD